MSIRVLGGVAKGMPIATPKSFTTRPTSVTLKRKLFDSIQDFSEHQFIDLCCGSGSIGIEALSRNASKAIFIDSHNLALEAVKKNLKALEKYEISKKSRSQIIKVDASKWIKSLSDFDHPHNVLFFDPPYHALDLYQTIYTEVFNSGLKMKLIMEGCSQKTMKLTQFLEKFPGHTKVFEKGTSYFVIYDIG